MRDPMTVRRGDSKLGSKSAIIHARTLHQQRDECLLAGIENARRGLSRTTSFARCLVVVISKILEGHQHENAALKFVRRQLFARSARWLER